MNPIEKDLKNYYGTSSDSDILEHYGTKRHSGRYPWGSGDNPYQHSGDFLSRVETLKKKGMSENEILDQINSTLPKEYQLGLTEFRVARRKAIHERKASEYEKIAALKEQGLGWKAIGEKLGMSESSVRSKYAGTADKKAQRAENIADTLKKEVDKKGMIDISEGANLVMGVSQSELDDAAYTLEAEYGYKRYGVGIRQPTNIRQQTNITVLAKPEFDQKYAYQHQDQIDSLGDYHLTMAVIRSRSFSVLQVWIQAVLPSGMAMKAVWTKMVSWKFAVACPILTLARVIMRRFVSLSMAIII